MVRCFGVAILHLSSRIGQQRMDSPSRVTVLHSRVPQPPATLREAVLRNVHPLGAPGCRPLRFAIQIFFRRTLTPSGRIRLNRLSIGP